MFDRVWGIYEEPKEVQKGWYLILSRRVNKDKAWAIRLVLSVILPNFIKQNLIFL